MTEMQMAAKTLGEYDVIVIGGSAAGLNGALMLGRSRRRVLVVDSGEPRNAPAHAMHGMLGHDGRPPSELLAMGRDEVRAYGVELVDGTVTGASVAGEGAARRFAVTLDDGSRATARRLLVTSGLTDHLPDIPGMDRHWGSGVLHCPYCHGWEVRDRRVAIVATGAMAIHQTLLFRQLTERTTLLTNGIELPAHELALVEARGVRIVDGRVAEVEGDDEVTGVRLEDGSRVECDAVAVGTRLQARASFLTGLGLHLVEHPSGMGEHLPVDAIGRTDVDGVWAAGNVTDVSAQVGTAASAGATAGAQINAEMAHEDAELALAAASVLTSAGRSEDAPALEQFDRNFWEEHHGNAWETEDNPHGGGVPSPYLVAAAEAVEPGTALDAGCGDGTDATWLAENGWKVTATDIAQTALDRARSRAEAAGAGDGITWQQADLTEWQPGTTYDLVSSHYVHLPGRFSELVERLASWVAPGGTLLVVGHDPDDQHVRQHAAEHLVGDAVLSVNQLAGVLDRGEWQISAEARSRTVTVAEREVVLRDTVLVARRT